MSFSPFRARDLDQIQILALLLAELDVKLPEQVSVGADRLMRIHAFRPDPHAIAQQVLALDDDGMRRLMFDVGVAHALEGSSGPGSAAVMTITRALQEALAEVLFYSADDILDQLRADFDRAGELVHEAAQLGINARTTDRDIVKADNIEDMRDAWTALPGLTATLDQVASVRILLSRATGVPPEPALRASYAYADHSDPAIGAMFHPEAPNWREDFEETWQMWLRLCQSEPARLLTLEEAAAAAAGDLPSRPRPAVIELEAVTEVTV